MFDYRQSRSITFRPQFIFIGIINILIVPYFDKQFIFSFKKGNEAVPNDINIREFDDIQSVVFFKYLPSISIGID